MAVRPRFRWYFTLKKSSRKPTEPKHRASTSTIREEKSPFTMYRMPNTRHIRLAPMNTRPPMVGVPALVACQLGPTSRISCPAFSRRRAGITM